MFIELLFFLFIIILAVLLLLSLLAEHLFDIHQLLVELLPDLSSFFFENAAQFLLADIDLGSETI